MSTSPAATATIDPVLVEHAQGLRERARSLRAQADQLSSPLAVAYRRRAAEFEFEAWVSELQSGLPNDEVTPAMDA